MSGFSTARVDAAIGFVWRNGRQLAAALALAALVSLLFGTAHATTQNVTLTVTAGGTAVTNTQVEVYDSTEHLYLTTSNGDGTYSVSLPAGSYQVVAQAPASDTPAYASTRVPLTVSGAPVNQTIALPAANVVAKVVAPDGSTLSLGSTANVWVEIDNAAGNYLQDGPPSPIVSAHGYFGLALAPGTTYTLKASPSGTALAGDTPGRTTVTAPASGPATQVTIALTTANVTGVVYRSDGTTPAANDYIQVLNADGSYANGVDGGSTGSNGAYALNLPAGTWVLDAQGQGSDTDARQTVTVTAGGTVTQNIRLTRPNVTGTVFQSNGTPVTTSVNVQVLTSSGNWTTTSTRTDAGGAYSLHLDPGDWELKVDGSPPDIGTTVPITVPATGPALTQNVTLVAPNVSGTVFQHGGTRPVANDWITVLSASGGYAGIDGVSTDLSGRFGLYLPAGTWQLQAQGANGDAGVTVTVTAGSTPVTQNITLAQPNLVVTVKDPTGATVQNANVNVQPVGGGLNGGYGQTDASGNAAFLLTAGDYTVGVSAPWGSPYSGGPSQTVTVAASGAQTLAMSLFSPNANGIVTTPDHDAAGNAVTPTGVGNAYVFVHNADYTFTSNAPTNSDGTFSVYLPPTGGPYVLTASPPPGSAYDGSTGVTVSGPSSATITLRLLNRNVHGTVYEGSTTGSVAKSDGIDIHSADYSFFTWATTDSTGSFGAGLAPGTYVATAHAQDGYTDSPPVTITVNSDGSFTPANLALVLGKPELKGTVVDGSGQPVTGGYVFVHQGQDWSTGASAQVGSDGTFVVGGLQPGSGYTVEVDPPWGSQGLLHTTVSNVTIPSDQTQWPVTVEKTTQGDHKLYLTVATDTITVTVMNGTTPVTTGAIVSAFQDAGGYASTSTPTSGSYVLHVSDGTWHVTVSPTSSNAGWVFASQPQSVTVSSSASAQTATLAVTNADASVTGSVVDASGNAVGANSAWVQVSTPNGIGNGGPVRSGGTFDVAVPAGTYQVYVYPNNPSLGSPAPVPVSVASGGTTNAGTLQLVARDAQIQGKLTYAGSGAAISGAEVFAYQPDGGNFADATTQADGSYTLHVSAGDWEIGVSPLPTDPWVWQGTPVHLTIASGATSTGNDFTAAPVAGHIAGTVLDPSGNVASVDGWAQASGSAGTSGAPVINGSFSIPAVAGSYTVQLSLAPGSPYISTSSPKATVSSSGTVTTSPSPLTIQLEALDRTISGKLINLSGATVTGSDVTVSASDNNGNYEQVQVDASGNYSLPVGVGTWHVGVDVTDPNLSEVSLGDGTGSQASSTVTFSTGGATSQTRDVVVAVADQTLQGTVTDASGTAIPFAWVAVDSPPSSTTPVHTGANADDAGHFSIKVPTGTYLVTASAKVANQDQPSVQTVAVAGGSQSVSPLVLAFRSHSATITGTVSAPVSGLTIEVNAWSDKGGVAQTTADASGNYTLNVAGNDTWHISASALSGTTAYVSGGGTAVTLGASGTGTAAVLTLSAQTVQATLTASFDATKAATLVFGDVTMNVPSGTIDTQGQVRITASPLPAPTDTAVAHPVGIGYSFLAFNSSGTQVKSRFPNSIRITFPYDPSQLTALGLTPDQLAPAYLDPTTNTYRPADNVVVDTTAHTISFSTDHFTNFVLETATQAAPTISAVSPTSATAGQAQTVTITGTGFLSGASVLVGSYAATSVTVSGPTSLTATLPATVPAGSYSVTVANSSGASGTKAGALTLTGSASPLPTSSPAPDLAVSLSTFPDRVKVGDLLTYILTVKDVNGVRATGMKLTFTLPDGVTLVSTYADHGPGTCTGTKVLTCMLDYIAGSDVATARIMVRVDAAGSQPASGELAFDQSSTTKKVAVTTSVPNRAAAPTVAVGALTAARFLRVSRAGVLGTTLRVDGAATVTVRVLAGTPRRPLWLGTGSSLAGVRTGRPHLAIVYRVTQAQAVGVRLLLPHRRPLRNVYLQVIAAGPGGATSTLVRVE